MKNEYLVKALEKLEEEAQKDEVFKAVHKMIEPMLYDAEEATLQDIAEGKKSYGGAMKQMETEARKKKTGNHAVIPPAEAEKILKGYFGINSKSDDVEEPKKQVVSIFDL